MEGEVCVGVEFLEVGEDAVESFDFEVRAVYGCPQTNACCLDVSVQDPLQNLQT